MADSEQTPWWDAPDEFRRMRDVLAQAGYTHAALKTRGDTAPAAGPLAEAVQRRRTAGETPLDTLIRLFAYGLPVRREAARRALSPMTPEQWGEAGLLVIRGDEVAARVQLMPHRGLDGGDLWLASDSPGRDRAGIRSQYVMGVAGSSRTLAGLTLRRPCRRALDVGAGGGIQALLAAAHSDAVCATDRNPRAVAFAAFNARLNGLEHIEYLEGDLFAPVAGRRFDLIIANPPFVISPESGYLYRDSGLPGDAICREVVRQAPAFLEEGGWCQMLCNWAHVTGQDWRERLSGWCAGTGCDAWVLRAETEDAASYAKIWLENTAGQAAGAAAFDVWMDYYAREGIEAVSLGLLVLHRTDRETPWFCVDDGPETLISPCGEAVAGRFIREDALRAAGGDARFLDLPLRASPDVRLETRFAPTADGWAVERTHLRLVRGLAYVESVTPRVGGIVTQCRTPRPLRGLANEADPEELQALRRLYTHGFLVPADTNDPEGGGRNVDRIG